MKPSSPSIPAPAPMRRRHPFALTRVATTTTMAALSLSISLLLLRTDPAQCFSAPTAYVACRKQYARNGGFGICTSGSIDIATRCGMSISKWNDEHEEQRADDGEDGNDDEPITKEMFDRSMLEDPAPLSVSRKKKGSSNYKTQKSHDNRDSLPFVVKVQTPDPYTNPHEMLRQAKRTTEAEARKLQQQQLVQPKKTKQKKKGGGSATRRSNLVGMDGRLADPNGIAASVFSRAKDGSLEKVLGEFALDKNTNCGDLIEVGDREFEVLKARAQFKYAGGKRFVMVRKILEVKEITRIAEEESLKRSMMMSDGSGDGIDLL